jgi:predicted site-specific integrase-resolvase
MTLFGFKKKKDKDKVDVDYISIKDAAKLLGVYDSTIRSWYDQGFLEGFVTPTGQRKILRKSAEALRNRKGK